MRGEDTKRNFMHAKRQASKNGKAVALLKKIFPTAWQHIYFHGHYTFCGRRTPIDLDAMLANLAPEEAEERLPHMVDSIRLDPEMLSKMA
jgi:hypothetical protein